MNLKNYESCYTWTMCHEGFVEGIYIDTLGNPTCGVGHLLTKKDDLDDPKWKDKDYLLSIYEEDLDMAINDAKWFCEDFDSLPEEAQNVVVGLAFNLGQSRLSKFKKFRAALNAHDWDEAAAQLVDSRWYTQVGRRGPDYCNALKGL